MASAPSTPAEEAVREIKDLVAHAYWVKGDAPTSAVVDLFERTKHIDSVAVLDEGFVGIVSRLRFFAQIGRRFGYSLYENRPVRLLAEHGSVVEATADPIEAVTLATQREADRVYDDLIVVDEGRFLGIVSMRSLLVHHKDLLSASMAQVESLDARNRELLELQRLRSDFVARMTHELRSPLNTILGIARLLLEDEAVAARHARNLELMFARGRDLLGVIDNILDISRLEAGAMQPLLEAVDLPALVEDAARSTEALLVGKPVKVVVDAHGLPRAFVSDPSYLQRILTNLLANSAAATEVGTIGIAADVTTEGLRIRVSDTGCGIPPEALPRLFEPFTQAESALTRRRGGSGLGLAIVRGLLDALGGEIRVESRLGAGTTFSFELPEGKLGREEETR